MRGADWRLRPRKSAIPSDRMPREVFVKAAQQLSRGHPIRAQFHATVNRHDAVRGCSDGAARDQHAGVRLVAKLPLQTKYAQTSRFPRWQLDLTALFGCEIVRGQSADHPAPGFTGQ